MRVKKRNVTYELKKGLCPVNGMYSYSVFRNGMLVFMMDGNRASVFRPDEVETISVAGYPNFTVYRVWKWVFTGNAVLTDVLIGKIPKGSVLCPAVDKCVRNSDVNKTSYDVI